MIKVLKAIGYIVMILIGMVLASAGFDELAVPESVLSADLFAGYMLTLFMIVGGCWLVLHNAYRAVNMLSPPEGT